MATITDERPAAETLASDLHGTLVEACSRGVLCPRWIGGVPARDEARPLLPRLLLGTHALMVYERAGRHGRALTPLVGVRLLALGGLLLGLGASA